MRQLQLRFETQRDPAADEVSALIAAIRPILVAKGKRSLQRLLHLNAVLWEAKLSGQRTFDRGTLIA
jgi:hypothetical protein